MSLSRLAMRIATTRALKGATLAETRVFDSAVDPIDQTIAETRQPILIVTTDDHEMEVTGRDLGLGNVSCELVIEAAIASRVELNTPDGDGGEVTIAIPHTDEGMELALDVMEHQIMAALTRERSDWSRVWMKLVPRVSRHLSRRGASVEKGVRFAARQIVLTCDLIEAPTDGAAILSGSTWEDVLAMMAGDPELVSIGTMLRAEIDGTPLSDWRRAANMLGIHLATADAIGIAEFLDAEGNPVTLDEIVLATADGASFTVDADA